MSSLNKHTPVVKTNNRSKPIRRNRSLTRSQAPSSINTNITSTDSVVSVTEPTDSVVSVAEPTEELTSDVEYETSTNHGNILFVYLDVDSQLTSNLMASLRAINHDILTYTDLSSCLDFLQSSNDQIFLIAPFTNTQLIEDFHNTKSVEAMFILNSDMQVDSRLPKWYGVYAHLEGLLAALKATLQWFEQTQMELFVFERDRMFLWSQLWKEEFIRLQKSKVSSSNKEKLVQVAENHYRGNLKINQTIKEFNQSYVKNNALQWCFFSRFPSALLHRALYSHSTEHLQACRFLLNDASRMIQLASRKPSCELYKGMKTTNEFLDKLENHVGKLICPQGFLQCVRSRKTALETASSLDHRHDLLPVLFKITYDASVRLAELHNKDTPSFMIFNVYTVFRVKYFSRGPISVVKIQTADEGGAKLAREYRMKHKDESVQALLDQLLSPPTPPVILPPPQQPPSSLLMSSDISPSEVGVSVISQDDDDDETQAQNLIARGNIDQGIAIYQRLKPESARVFNIIGALYAEKKGDYDSAIKYHEKALQMQEKVGEDDTNTLSQLGTIYQNRHEFDLALSYHSRALDKRKAMPQLDQKAIASNLNGIANAYWGQQNFTEALNYAQQALILNESIEHGNEANIAANLAILANIHHNSGNGSKALEIATRALTILERSLPPNSFALATLVNNVATIQVSEKLFTDARRSFDKALEICKISLPEGHPKRVTMENNIQRMIAMIQENTQNSQLES